MMGVDRFKAKSDLGRVRPGALLTLAVALTVVAAACSSGGGEKSGGAAGGGAGLEHASEHAREGKGEIPMPNGTDPGSERPNGVTPGVSVRIGAAKHSTGRGVTKTMPKDVGKQGERDGEEGEEGEDKNENERAPLTPLAANPKIRTGRPTIAQTAPGSRTAKNGGPAAPGDFSVWTNTETATNANIIPEPDVASNGPGVLMTWNTYAAGSTDGGRTFSYLNPATLFPSAYGGLCCDQLAYYEPTNGLFLWALQYSADGSSNNAIRLAVANNQTDMANGSYWYWDITPQSMGAPNGTNFDQPKIESDGTFVWMTVAQYGGRGGSVMFRMPISDIADHGSLGWTYWLPSLFSPMFADGSGSTMYAAAHVDTDTLRVYEVATNSNTMLSHDIDHTSYPRNLPYTCPRTGGSATSDWCQRRSFGGGWAGDDRMKTGWLSGSTLGFAWTASQGAGGFGTFNYPYVDIVRVNTSNWTLVDQPIIWNASSAWIWPKFAVNARGDIGGSVQNGGGGSYQSCDALIRDGYSGGGWSAAFISGSSVDPTDTLSGDYAGVQGNGFTWDGTCDSFNSAGSGQSPHFAQFGREQDNPLRTLSVGLTGSGVVTANRPGINCGGDCSEQWVAGTAVRLYSTPSAGNTFVGWGGACSGQQNFCDVTLAGNASVTAQFAPVPAVASLGSASSYEGDSGSHTIEFPVTLDRPATSTVTVHYKVFHGSGDTATAGSDFTAATGTLTFNTVFSGKTGTVQQIPVTIKGDTTKENDERFSVQLTSVTGATLGTNLSHGTIRNDDKGSGVRLTVSSVSIVEGDQVATAGGSNYVQFHIHLSKPVPSGKTVKVTYHTVAGSAHAGSDFTSIGTTTVTFTAGQSDKIIQVRVFADTAVEANETFSLVVTSATNATLENKTGTGTIINDD